MKTSSSSQYGLMAVGYIALHPKEGNIMAQTIAKEYTIPLEYLLKILQQLVRGGVLRSKRGPRGGFVLGKAPAEITLLQIIEAIEGSAGDSLSMAEQTKNQRFAVRMEDVCKKATEQQNNVLRSTTLAQLIS